MFCFSGGDVRSLRPLWRKTLIWPSRLYINLVFQVVIALCRLGNFSFLINKIVSSSVFDTVLPLPPPAVDIYAGVAASLAERKKGGQLTEFFKNIKGTIEDGDWDQVRDFHFFLLCNIGECVCFTHTCFWNGRFWELQ